MNDFDNEIERTYECTIGITKDDVLNYCSAARDDNPLHFGESGNVVPGGLITSLFLSNPKPGFFVRNMDIQFHHVTHFPTDITIRRTLIEGRERKFGLVGTVLGEAVVNGITVARAKIETFKPNEKLKERYEQG